MVAICAGCNDMQQYMAVITGIIAGGVIIPWHYILIKLKIDDPLDAVPGNSFK